MKLIVSLTHVIIFLFCTQHLLSQSEVVPKGQNGFEMDYGMGFIEGKNLQLAYIGGSINGKIDLGVGLASIPPNPSYIFGGAYHIGGETDQAGLALSAGYVIFPSVDNYFVFGTGFYANEDIGGITLVPSVNVEFATQNTITYAGAFGMGIFTKGQVVMALRPSFVFSPERSYISLTIGILARS